MGEAEREEVDSEARPSLEADLGSDGGRGWCGGVCSARGQESGVCRLCLSARADGLEAEVMMR